MNMFEWNSKKRHSCAEGQELRREAETQMHNILPRSLALDSNV